MDRNRRQREAWFEDRVGPCIAKMAKDIVIDAPDDIRAWIAGYVDRKLDREATDAACMRADERNTGSGGSGLPSVEVQHLQPASSADTVDVTASGSSKKGEADTADPEDVSDLSALLLPSGTLPTDVESFSLSYSKALLAGWVKQDSPCCAAASVAGAWNALRGRARKDPGAMSSQAVLGSMRTVIEHQISSMTGRFERLLGGSVQPLIQGLTAELALEGKHLGGRGPKAAVAKPPCLLRLTRSLTMRERSKPGHASTFDLLWELYEGERKEASAITASATTSAATRAVAEMISAGSTAAATSLDDAYKATRLTLSEGPPAKETVRPEPAISLSTSDRHDAGDTKGGISEASSGRGDTARAAESAAGSGPGVLHGGDSCPPVPPKRSFSTRSDDATLAGNERLGIPLTRPRSANAFRSCQWSTSGDREQEYARKAEEGIALRRECWRTTEDDTGGEDVPRGGGYVEDEKTEERHETEASEGGGEIHPEKTNEIMATASMSSKRRSKVRERRNVKGSFKIRGSDGSASGGGATLDGGQSPRWRWKKDLCDLLKRMGGLDKLCTSSPSTGAFGNLGVIATVQDLDRDTVDPDNAQVTADLFMGKGSARTSRLPVPLSRRDGDEEKEKQWAALREAFMTERQVMLFHLSNHYALIFALREWRTAPSVNMDDRETSASSYTGHTASAPSDRNDSVADGVRRAGGAYESGSGAELAASSVKSDIHDKLASNAVDSNVMGGISDGCAGAQDDAAVKAKGDRRDTGSRGKAVMAEGVSSKKAGWTRQMLTARRGQRPTAWIDFEEARNTMLGWEGYKILVMRRGRR